jgi:hypothetical protein
MSCGELPSEYLFQLCEEIKPAVHGGRFVSGEEFSAFVRRLNTARALAEEIEEEKRILERHNRVAAGRKIGLAIVGPNVVPFPGIQPGGR